MSAIEPRPLSDEEWRELLESGDADIRNLPAPAPEPSDAELDERPLPRCNACSSEPRVFWEARIGRQLRRTFYCWSCASELDERLRRRPSRPDVSRRLGHIDELDWRREEPKL